MADKKSHTNGDGKFFALLNRMKYINRWGLMRCSRPENLAEHTLETVYIAHALALLHNARCGGSADVGKCVLRAAYHDMTEILTGDLPTPVKYKTEQIKEAYLAVDRSARETIARTVPEDIRTDYEGLFTEDDSIEYKIVKAADKISALIKCREELFLGNAEFIAAAEAQAAAVEALGLEAAGIFIAEYMEHYFNSLDGLLGD